MNPQITAAVAFSVLLAGCASTKEGAGRDQMTAQVGVYSPPAPGQQPIRIGVPAFMVNEGVEAK
ncbi:MAG TPA: hypothetical protein VK348_01220, partial [Planctomycetota bacterium]|nr:hypothetical protein [Planctomycetota bacterium]